MITIKNVRTLSEEIINFDIPGTKNFEINANEKLLLLPGVIDSHISFGLPQTEQWKLAINAAVRGGITTAIEIPSQTLQENSIQHLEKYQTLFASELSALEIPLNHLHYLLYQEKNLDDIDHIGASKKSIKGIVIQLDCKNKETLNDNWNDLFRVAAQQDLPILINTCNENSEQWPKNHSLLEKAIEFTQKWSNRLYVLNVTTQEEINLIEEAKRKSLLVSAETTAYHLYTSNEEKANSLWGAINNGVIETIGSGYNINQPNQERVLFNGNNFDLADPVFMLPLLFTAYHKKKLTLDKIAALIHLNIQDIFELNKTTDYVLVDLEKKQSIKKINSGNSVEIELTGWPVYTIINGQIFLPPKTGYHLIHPDYE